MAPDHLARRYVDWLRRRAVAIVVAHVLILAGAVFLIVNHLPLRADFSYLLPQDAQSVRDLRRLEARIKAGDSALVVVRAPDSARRAAAVDDMLTGLRSIRAELVEHVDADDAAVRAFFKERQHLFVPLEDLRRARDALQARIQRAKLEANPLFIELDEPDSKVQASEQAELEELRTRRREAVAKLDRSGNVSADGRIHIIQVRTPFTATDAGKGVALYQALDQLRDRVESSHPGVEIGLTGSVITSVAEHAAIADGMLLSSVVTGVLVALVLALYFRSATLLVLLVTTLGIATATTFGIAAVTIGHLNAATAFLGAIIAGNGVNYGIVLIARYLEERRHHDADYAMSRAIVGTVRPTAIASLGAAIAYGSLAATSFKGFADFAVIGAIGMLVCWTISYVLLPVLVLRWGRNTRRFTGDPIVGTILVRLMGFRRFRVVCAVGLLGAALSVAIVVQYIDEDPFEYDITQLRSKGEPALVARGWMAISDEKFGRGITGRTYIAADRMEHVPAIVSALRSLDADVPAEAQTIGSINSILDVVPERQPEKLAVLAEIRALLDDDALEALDQTQRDELRELRPPDGLTPVTIENIPAELRQRLTERDGRVGYFISIRPSNLLDEWDGRDLIRFASAIRRLELPTGETVTTSGSSVIFADIIESIERDGLRVTAVAGIGLVAMVLLLVGRNRRSFAVLVGTASGTLLMVAFCALIDLKVNFLDFVALPITLGLGIDYAINVAHRHDHEQLPDPIATLRTIGSAVFLCALTTIIGYGSLLLSDNLAIRGFGIASLVGEVACLISALVLVPAILAVSAPRTKWTS